MSIISSEAEGLEVEIERLRRRVLGLSHAQLDAVGAPVSGADEADAGVPPEQPLGAPSRRALIRASLDDLAELAWDAETRGTDASHVATGSETRPAQTREGRHRRPEVPDHGDAALGYQLVTLLQECLHAGESTAQAAYERAVRLRRELA